MQAAFFHKWRQDIRLELQTDKHGFIGRRCADLATKVPEDFPNPDILLAYLEPLTSRTHSSIQNIPNFIQHCPNIGAITNLCQQQFSWGDSKSIIIKLSKIVWPGIVFQMLYKV
jgi:holliday junction resolvase YEN1